MEKVNWHEFWSGYCKGEVKNEHDLFVEVGKTVAKEPISQAAFDLSIDLVRRDLELNGSDRLLELCCGNGLMTLRLAPFVREIRAVDFAQHLIDSARKFRNVANVQYVCAEAAGYISELAANETFVPSKILLSDALGYFEPDALASVLASASKLTTHKLIFAATGIPCDDLKWNFYNTPERVRRYEENQRLASNSNDGIGRWWRREELERLARDQDLNLVIKDQPTELSNFRVDAIFRSRTSP
jgi:hypothetical protein